MRGVHINIYSHSVEPVFEPTTNDYHQIRGRLEKLGERVVNVKAVVKFIDLDL